MVKVSRLQSKRDARRAAKVINTADIAGVSTRQVQRVLAGDQDNDKILGIYMELDEREAAMLEEVRNWTSIFNKVPSNSKPAMKSI